MSQRTISIIAIVLGGLLLVSLGLLVLFGVRLSDAGKVKLSEIKSNLAKQEKQLKADFQAERETVLSTYTADVVFGSFSFSYPKVWSTNVKQEKGSTQELIFLADPNLIVENRDLGGPFTAMRVQVYGSSADSVIKDMHSKYTLRSTDPFKEEDTTVSGLKGRKFTGTETDSKKNISFVILPLRDKALYIGTDDNDKYQKNLSTIIKSFKISK